MLWRGTVKNNFVREILDLIKRERRSSTLRFAPQLETRFPYGNVNSEPTRSLFKLIYQCAPGCGSLF